MSFFANRSSRHAARLGPALTVHPARHIGFSCNRRRGEQTVRTGNPFKLALCLALAIPFALAACGGGGGTPAMVTTLPEGHYVAASSFTVAAGRTVERGGVRFSCAAGGAACAVTVDTSGKARVTGGRLTVTRVPAPETPETPAPTPETPAPTPETPAPTPEAPETPEARTPPSFFPITAQHAYDISGAISGDPVASVGLRSSAAPGKTLANLIPASWTGKNFPQFSEFDFDAAVNMNGIPVQKATKTQADRYAAIAYQAVLDHSMFIIQGGVYNDNGRKVTGHIRFGTGNPTTGNAVIGTWTGKAIGFEYDAALATFFSPPQRPLTLAHAESRRVEGDVTIRVASGNDATARIDNWRGGLGSYEPLSPPLADGGSPPHDLFFRANTKQIRVKFYGPGAPEAAGWFNTPDIGNDYIVTGGFAAKKQ